MLNWFADGDGWVKLRSDDFSDLTEHYQPRGQSDALGLPEVSKVLLETIKGMMSSRPYDRMTLDEVMTVGPVRRLKGLVGVKAALVEEEMGFLESILVGHE